MNLTNLTNNELVELCAQQPDNRSAWMEFYDRFDERIWLVVYRECKQKEIAKHSAPFRQVVQDLVQDVYVRLVENDCKALKDFIGISENSIFTWLGIVAKNVVRNYSIKMGAKKRPLIGNSIDDIKAISKIQIAKDKVSTVYINGEDDFSVEYLKEEIEEILERHLRGKGKERNKLIFKLYIYEGFSPDEIASHLKFSLSVKTVRNIISDIKRELREELLKQEMEIF